MVRQAQRAWIAAAVMLGLCGAGFAATLAAGHAAGDPGDTDVVVPISLVSAMDEAVAGAQFEIVFSSAALSLAAVNIGAAASAAEKELSSSLIGEGRMRVIVVGFNQNVIADGVIANAQFSIAADSPDSIEEIMLEEAILSDPLAEEVPSETESGSITIGTPAPSWHSADYQEADWDISLSELLRAIQLFNGREYSCDAASEDGYAPASGNRMCRPHDSDYAPQDWKISISELLRLIQFFNSGGYHREQGTEDGFAPGPEPSGTRFSAKVPDSIE